MRSPGKQATPSRLLRCYVIASNVSCSLLYVITRTNKLCIYRRAKNRLLEELTELKVSFDDQKNDAEAVS